MKTQVSHLAQIVAVRFDADDDLLLCLREAVAQHGIKNGLFIGGIGSVHHYHVHVVDTSTLPVRDLFIKGEAPLDILSVTGAVMNGRVHAHISFSGAALTMGGHLEEGNLALTFAQVYILNLPDADITDWDRSGTLA